MKHKLKSNKVISGSVTKVTCSMTFPVIIQFSCWMALKCHGSCSGATCYFPNNNWNYMRKCFIEQIMSWNLTYIKKLKANGFVSNVH